MRTLFCLVVCAVALVAYVDRYGAGALESGASRAVKAAGRILPGGTGKAPAQLEPDP